MSSLVIYFVCTFSMAIPFVDNNFIYIYIYFTAYLSQSKMDDLPHFVEMETNLSPETLFPDNLEMGLLESDASDETWKELSDGSDSGIDGKYF